MDNVFNLLSLWKPEEQLWFLNWYDKYLNTGDASYENSTWVNENEYEVPKGMIYLMELTIKHYEYGRNR